ncbi:MoaD/ThiS family protein [Palleronia caenipelagi]|uniref:MoaD/ThiS family protein n=1 Tax=Palleronia caenipelagi TaxID=2489174 RepID=A0A547Q772_9RHOB|nr:MoaD/ThiS family protein [Palleronia caenipelagi]TRD22237.1 MoaD/ThiS family protein [Palleronia caenipelagi]
MKVTLKLFASLSSFLPREAQRNKVDLDVAEGTTIQSLLDHHKVPREKCHLVLVNGVFHAPEERETVALKDSDVLAVWPPVAGG